MKNTEDFDVAAGLYEIGYAVMLVEENAYLARPFGFVSVAKPRMITEQLCLFVDEGDGSLSSFRIVGCGVVVNILKSDFGLTSPVYFCQVFIRRFVSSLEIVRRSSESLRPRCTIRSKANSRTMSS
jgi:hypothetical protein